MHVCHVLIIIRSYQATGVIRRQQVAPVRDWRSDCLEKQGEPVVEICGVLGRLHSGQGLAQSNNNAKLNNSAEHRTIVAGNRVHTGGEDGKVWETSAAR